MRITACFFTTLLSASALVAQDAPPSELAVVPSVDVQKYSGNWYEIARLPNRFQADCSGDVTATYMLDGDDIIVVNRCRKEDGTITEAKGRARRSSDDLPNSKLKVRFAPAFLSFLPFVWGDYWIIDLDIQYTYAVIGEPHRKYLWILARTKKLDDATMSGILERLKQKGYDVEKLVYTNHVQ